MPSDPRIAVSQAEPAANATGGSGSPVFFSGPLMTPKDGPPDVLEEAERALRASIGGWLGERSVPVAFSAAACGADILFCEAALAAGIPLHVVLPFSVERFAALSVRIGEGPGIRADWERRYRQCLGGAASVTELWRGGVADTVIDHHFLRANSHLAGETILAAHALGTPPQMLAVLDMRRSASLAGARHSSGAFASMGHAVSVIPSPFERRGTPADPVAPSPFAPVVFASLRTAGGDLLSGAGFDARAAGGALSGRKVCAGWPEAFAAAFALLRRVREAALPARIVCDFGPVLEPQGKADAAAVVALEADLPAVAAGAVFATAAFAACELAAAGDPARYAPAGDLAGRAAPRVFEVLRFDR